MKCALCMELMQGDKVDINNGQVQVKIQKLTGKRVRVTFLAPREIPITKEVVSR